MLSDRILATLARRENAEALRQPSHIQKNVNQHIEMNADRTGKSTKHYRRPLINLCSTQLARERIANRRSAMANFPYGSRFVLEGLLLEPTTPVFLPRV